MSKTKNIAEMHYKKCSHCDQILPLTNFHKSSSSPDGLHYLCVECTKELAKLSRERLLQERPYNRLWRRIIDMTSKAGEWNKGTKLTQSWGIYGGRGITVSEEFLDYDTFEQHMIELKNKALELYGSNVDLLIDRIDVNGHYERGNLRFVSAIESAMNKRECQVEEYEHLGLVLPITWWCRIYEINRGAVLARMKKGWNIARALNEPVDVKFRKNKVKQIRDIEEEVVCIDGVYMINGHMTSLAAISRKFEIPIGTIKARLKRGMTIKEAISVVN